MKTMLLNNYKYKKCHPNLLIYSARAILELVAHLKTKVRQQLSGQLLWSPVQLLVRLESCSQPLVGQSVTYTISPAMSLTIVCLFLWVCYKDKSLIIRRGSTCKRTYHGSDFHFKNLPSACLDLTDFKIQCMSTPSPNISNAGNTIDPLYTIEVDRFRIYQSKIN